MLGQEIVFEAGVVRGVKLSVDLVQIRQEDVCRALET